MGIFADWLNGIVKDKQDQINAIKEDIAKLEEDRKYADEAAKLFKEAGSDMRNLHEEVQICFKGEAAKAFSNKLLLFIIICDTREDHMYKRIANIDKQLASLKKQKDKSKKTIEAIENVKNFFKIR